MIKTLLLLLLLIPGANAAPVDIDCNELYIILEDAVAEQYIKEHEARELYANCLALNK